MGASWRHIGPASELSKKPCRLMYSPVGRDSDVCLFYVNEQFLPWTPAVLTPVVLCVRGTSREADGVLRVFCPWHDYSYDLKTGKSGTSLEQQVYEVKLVDGDVYVKHASHLSLRPFPANQKS